MYNHELTLVVATAYTKDADNNQVPAGEHRTTVLCQKISVTRSEFYLASQNNLKPEAVFIIHSYEYGGEDVVEFEGEAFSVIRAFERSFEETELVCERKTGVRHGD